MSFTAQSAEQILLPVPRFGDFFHIEAHRFLLLLRVAERCLDVQGFCLCRDGCYDRRHRGARPSRAALYRMDREELNEVIKKLLYIGYIEEWEVEEARGLR